MIFLSACTSDTCLFDHNGDIIHINILMSVWVEPTNAACPPSTATSDTLSHYTTDASPQKDAKVVHITKPDAAVHSVYGVNMSVLQGLASLCTPHSWAQPERNIHNSSQKIAKLLEPLYKVYCSIWLCYMSYLSILFLGMPQWCNG